MMCYFYRNAKNELFMSYKRIKFDKEGKPINCIYGDILFLPKKAYPDLRKNTCEKTEITSFTPIWEESLFRGAK